MPLAIAWRISANQVSVAGLAVGVGAALAYAHWSDGWYPLLGLGLSIAWLIADGLDGMVARATGTASPLGRVLDGLCDHGVFIMIYVAMALSIGTAGGWALAIAAGAAHVVQSSLYEGERARFHRRRRAHVVQSSLYEGERARFHRRRRGGPTATPQTGAALVRGYDRMASLPERLAAPFERAFAAAPNRLALGGRYADAAVPAMRLLSLQSANVRVLTIFVACVLGDPRLFWWFELVPLTALLVAGLVWHRRIERGILRIHHSPAADQRAAATIFGEQGQV